LNINGKQGVRFESRNNQVLRHQRGISLDTSAIIIYVHLGFNPAPTLVNMALSASKNMKEASLILITDHPENFSTFPGEIIEFSTKHRTKEIRAFVQRNKELKSISGGYWLFALERLFAMRPIAKGLPKDVPIIHFESDVYSFLNIRDVSELSRYYKGVAVPRIDANTGIASVLFARNQESLERALSNLLEVLAGNPDIKSDMHLLGQGLNLGILEELWSTPNPSTRLGRPPILLDGAEIGQYFFGADPLHTGGVLKTGFITPGSQIKFDEMKFSLTESPKSLYVNTGIEMFKIGCLHNHAKRNLETPENDSETWDRFLQEANGTMPRITEIAPPDLIHTKRVSLLNRFRRARNMNKNLLKYIVEKIFH
jgi:hypothetical protein